MKMTFGKVQNLQKISIKKGGNVMENITTKVEIADHTGHTTALLTQRETIDLVSDNERWVFAGGQLVEPEELAEADWTTVGTVRVMPRIVFRIGYTLC